jgi:hypothetical protein
LEKAIPLAGFSSTSAKANKGLVDIPNIVIHLKVCNVDTIVTLNFLLALALNVDYNAYKDPLIDNLY